MVQHILTASQFTREELDTLFTQTDRLRSLARDNRHQPLTRKTIALLFYEPSTRTRMSFGLAAKGESLEDTVRILAGYEVNAIVIRHKEAGAAQRAARVSPVPIINAGDGGDEHPTQALLDLYTILRSTDRNEITLALSGDLEHSRTVRSLCRLIIRYGEPPRFRLLLVSPTEIRLAEDVRGELARAGIPFEETDRLARALPDADVFYQTRVQRERYGHGDRGDAMHAEIERAFAVTGTNVGLMKPSAVILHPLPRLGEIATDVDTNPRAKYFDQARNGLFIRMALLEQLLASDG